MRKLGDNADFWAGLMFVCFGVVAVYLSRDYPMGTAMRMGPGYFPTYLGIIMIVLGLLVGGRGLMARQIERIGTWAYRPVIILSVAVILYGFLIETIGFIPSLILLTIISTFASPEKFRPIEVIFVAAGFVVIAVGIFIYGIGLPYPLFWWSY